MSNMIELGNTVVEHSVPLICDALKNLPLLFEDREKYNQTMRDTWHMQWKKFMLRFLVSPWLNSRHQQFHMLPSDLQIVLQKIPRNAYWLFDSAMFFQYAPSSSQIQYMNERDQLEAIITNRQPNQAPPPPPPPSTSIILNKKFIQGSSKYKRHRIILVVTGLSEIVCAWVELPQSNRIVLMDEDSEFFAKHFRTQHLDAASRSIQIWALNSTLNRLRELHMTFGVAFSLKVAEVMFEAASLYVPELNPLRPLIEFVIFQLGSVYEQATKQNAKHSDLQIPSIDELTQLIQEFEKRVIFDELYWDVRQRVISRTLLVDEFEPSDLHPIRTLKYSLHADPNLQSKHPHESVQRLFEDMKQMKLQNGIFSMYFSERCEIESSLLQEFEKLNLSTQHNIELRKWADHVQKELELKTNLNRGTSNWPYTVLCMMSDLMHFSVEHHKELAAMDPELWDGSETDDIGSAAQRIFSWVNAKQRQPLNMSVGSNNTLVRDFIIKYLVPRNRK